ncbi:MAG TPA: hypothetical protein VFP44_03720 [Usitatibacter sp.]|nr:hypothetical protein [Usitatibacter sp.]
MTGEEREELPPHEAASTLVHECRMVLPGVQATFGFQLIAVFQQRFKEDLARPEQLLHLCSTSRTPASALAAAIFAFMAYMWYLLPRTNGRHAAT